MASQLGCFVSFPVNRILRNKRHFRPQIDLNCLLSSCHCFVFIVRQILRCLQPPIPPSSPPPPHKDKPVRILGPQLQDASGTSVHPQRSRKVSMLCMWIARLWPLFRHVLAGLPACLCMLFSGANWKATTEVAFLFGPHKTQKKNSKALSIVVVIACVAHATPQLPLARNVEWIEVKFCG